MNRKTITKNIGNLINTVKRLEPGLRECSENDIITICLSDKITKLLDSDVNVGVSEVKDE